MKYLRVIVALIISAAITVSAVGSADAEQLNPIAQGANAIPEVRIMDSEQVDIDVLEARYNNFILVERIYGVCLDYEGHGGTSDGYYISYRSVEGHEPGARYTTLCLYANSIYEDDVVERWDYRR